MAMTIVEGARGITGGVDTHLEVHVAAALDPVGVLLGTAPFPTTPGGYEGLLGWLESFGPVTKVGVEGTGSYGVHDAIHSSVVTSTRLPSGQASWHGQQQRTMPIGPPPARQW
jgi:hypothetical protein